MLAVLDAISIDVTYLAGAAAWISGVVVAMGAFIRSLLMRVLDEAREERRARMKSDEEYERLYEGMMAEFRRLP